MIEAVVLFLGLFMGLVWFLSWSANKKYKKNMVAALSYVVEAGGCVVYNGFHLYKSMRWGETVVVAFDKKGDFVREEKYTTTDDAIYDFVETTGIK
jgi:hypothetical protein